MKKTILYIVVAALCLIFEVKAQSQPILLTGQVSDPGGKVIPNVTLQIKGEKTIALSNAEGNFHIKATRPTGKLIVSHIGYKTVELDFNSNSLKPFNIKLKEDNSQLKEVYIVSTGYQNIPKERATGSFVLIDSALLNRRTGTNILDRLDGVTSGLIFNKNQQNPYASNISIRGRSTIFANSEPLIVLDNFPYQGDVNNINPNDIENITVLKDAAAASIWGVKAGNGVIVITTKNGKKNMPPTVSLNSNITIGNKPDIFYQPQLSSAEFIEVEQFLFNKGTYNSAINTRFSIISPAVEIFLKKRNNIITSSDSSRLINELKVHDVRNDVNKYLIRKSLNQQYSLNINGGGTKNKYYVSAGYDNNKASSVSNSFNRLTLNAKNSYLLLNDKLEWTSSIQLTNSNSSVNNDNYSPLSPYERIADENGNPLPTTREIRMLYADTAGKGRLLDWHYFPLRENTPKTTNSTLDYRLSTDVSYSILKPLKISAYYLFQKGIGENSTNQTQESFFTRNLINSFSQINQTSGLITYAIPPGGILDKGNSNYKTNTGRIQLNYNQNIGQNHTLNALAGFEVQENTSSNDSYRLYGYNPLTDNNANQAIDYKKDNPQYHGGTSGRITNGSVSNSTIDRSRSYFANASYTYMQQYILSASARWDESNIFGVKTSQKGVPLWSAGLGWNISDAAFYKFEWVPYLKIRATYGYNGNTDKSTSAYLTTNTSAFNPFNNPTLVIVNPPNPSLRWEKIAVTNLGVDFSLKKGLISGSIEYYQKNSTDLIANSPIAPQSGINQFRGNSANMLAKGIDLILNARLLDGKLKWNATVLFNYATDKVTEYKVQPGSNQTVVAGNYNNPLVGYPYSSLFSFPSGGLDTLGNPRGYLNGEISNNYGGILNSTDRINLKYNGTTSPIYFGSVRNDITYKGFDFSVNVIYKFKYSFMRRSLDYTTLFRGVYQQTDYNLRWQKKGDELKTSVPSLVYPANSNRNTFYKNSDVLIEKGDHIRLQDIRLSYSIKKSQITKLPFQMIQFYIYANNLGIVWRSNNLELDPDSPITGGTSTSIAFGLKATL